MHRNFTPFSPHQAGYKLCRVKRVIRGPKGIPYAVTHDGRTLRYPDPDIKAWGFFSDADKQNAWDFPTTFLGGGFKYKYLLFSSLIWGR